MQDAQGQTREIKRLLAGFPPQTAGDARVIFGNYITATEDFQLVFLTDAVTDFIKGRVPGFDGKWCPPPAALAEHMREIASKRVSDGKWDRTARLQIMQRDASMDRDPPEVRKAAVAAGLARLFDPAKPVLTEAELIEKKAEETRYLAKHDRFFLPDQSDDAMRKRLLKPR